MRLLNDDLAIQTHLTLWETVIAPLIKSWINQIFWTAEFNFTGRTQAWLLPDQMNQEIT